MRKSVVTAAVLSVSLALAGCAGSNAEVPQPKAKTVAEEIVSAESYAEYVKTAAEGLKTADAAKNSSKLGARFGAPMVAMRAANYKLQAIYGTSYKMPALVLDEKATPVVSGTSFPRTLATVTQPTADVNFPTLSIWKQANARANYQLWGQTFLLPGLDIPALKGQLADGDSAQAADATTLLADPAQVLKQYVTYSNSGKMGAVKFNADDEVYKQIAAQRTALKEAVGDLATVATSTAAGKNGYVVAPTENGGVVLMGELAYAVTVTRKDADSTLRLGNQIAALVNKKAEGTVDVKKKLSASYQMLLTFYIPPKSAGGEVQVIGATSPILTNVTNAE